MTSKKFINVQDYRKGAKRVLPAPVFHYLEGGADDEITLRENTAAFDRYTFDPRVLVDIEKISLRKRVLGCDLAMPLILSPTGMSRLFSHERELGAARAARNAGLMYSLSTMGTTSIEDIAGATDLKMFQIYIVKDRGLTREHVARCREAGYNAICLTVDTPVAGNRERDLRTGFTMPPRFSPSTFLSFAIRPEWSLRLLTDSNFRFANIDHRVDAIGDGVTSVIEYVNGQFDRTVTWRDVEWLAAEWGGPLAIKGLVTADDAAAARDAGASAVMVSNHGGRQLDGAPAPIDCVPRIRDRVGSALEIIVDGGVRRGAHIAKALALGADACSVGRPYLWGLSVGGQAGVEHILEILRKEMETTLALLGCQDVDNLNASHICDVEGIVPTSMLGVSPAKAMSAANGL